MDPKIASKIVEQIGAKTRRHFTSKRRSVEVRGSGSAAVALTRGGGGGGEVNLPPGEDPGINAVNAEGLIRPVPRRVRRI